jgi:hypothetical protein
MEVSMFQQNSGDAEILEGSSKTIEKLKNPRRRISALFTRAS